MAYLGDEIIQITRCWPSFAILALDAPRCVCGGVCVHGLPMEGFAPCDGASEEGSLPR